MIVVDLHEPPEIVAFLKQSIDTLPKTNLNTSRWADYMWSTWDKGIEHVERKQWGEILSGMDKVERQLRLEYQAHPSARLYLLIEGVIDPDSSGVTIMKRRRIPIPGRKGTEVAWVGSWHSRQPYARVSAWLSAIQRMGIYLVFTQDHLSTAQMLVQMFKTSQRQSTTLNRYTKPDIQFHENPQIMSLIGAYNTGISVVLAERVIRDFTTIHNMLGYSPEMVASTVEGIGIVKAKQMQRAFGKDV